MKIPKALLLGVMAVGILGCGKPPMRITVQEAGHVDAAGGFTGHGSYYWFRGKSGSGEAAGGFTRDPVAVGDQVCVEWRGMDIQEWAIVPCGDSK